MNIELFIEARKQLGLSQSELSEGICTQATLSRFENNGQIPALKILLKLCQRLHISLGDLFPKVEVKDSEVVKAMDQIEFFLITSEYGKANEILETIDIDQVEEAQALVRYYYLKGFILFFTEAPVMEVMFVFDQICMEEVSDSTIFRLLAFTGMGMIYMRENDNRKAEFYFNKVIGQIYHFPIFKMEDTWRVLHIVFESAVFFAWNEELEVSNALLHYAITICSDNHVTYYLARAALQLAKNAITGKEDSAVILELIYDARAYAKINRNRIALKELAIMEKEIKEKSHDRKSQKEATSDTRK